MLQTVFFKQCMFEILMIIVCFVFYTPIQAPKMTALLKFNLVSFIDPDKEILLA